MQSLSNHAPMTAKWNEEPTYPKFRIWHLNNSLLESPGLANLVENKIDSFFVNNRGSASSEMVWESFQAYFRGILISFKAYKDKARSVTRATLLNGIQELKGSNKMCVTAKNTRLLQEAYSSLKMLDAKEIAQEMLNK